MQTTLHTYRFDITKPEEKAAWKDLKNKLSSWPHCMESWGADRSTADGRGYHDAIEALNGKPITLETEHLFENQWNTAPVEGVTKNGLRVFDWKIDVWPNNKIKSGHYLEQTDEMREVRRNTDACGYCGKQEPAAKGYVFCPHCLDSEYLKAEELHLTRMRPVDTSFNENRAPLTEAESAHLMPLYLDAQLNGSTERGKARITKQRQDVERKFQNKTESAKAEHDAAVWILDHMPGMLSNWIYYDHTKKHSFGWRKPLSDVEVSALLDIISEFPFAYEIECADGRKLEAVA